MWQNVIIQVFLGHHIGLIANGPIFVDLQLRYVLPFPHLLQHRQILVMIDIIGIINLGTDIVILLCTISRYCKIVRLVVVPHHGKFYLGTRSILLLQIVILVVCVCFRDFRFCSCATLNIGPISLVNIEIIGLFLLIVNLVI